MTRSGGTMRRKFVAGAKTPERTSDPRLQSKNASAAALMAGAREEAQPTIQALTAIRDDPAATPSARVSAGRSLLEAAGMIGRERSAAKELLRKSVDEMTYAELEQAAEL